MRIVVTGGRDFWNWYTMWRVLRDLDGIDEMGFGDAQGADWMAWKFSTLEGIPYRLYRADWHTYGNSAGALRNAFMLEDFDPDLVVAFPGGPGTANCVAEAKRRGISVYRYNHV